MISFESIDGKGSNRKFENMKISEGQANDFLFGSGLSVLDYVIERTSVSKMIFYRNAEGREFDLLIHDKALAAAVFDRLNALNVRVVEL